MPVSIAKRSASFAKCVTTIIRGESSSVPDLGFFKEGGMVAGTLGLQNQCGMPTKRFTLRSAEKKMECL